MLDLHVASLTHCSDNRIEFHQKMGIPGRTTSLALFAGVAFAQSKYGENHVALNFDSQLVEQSAFPAPNATLYSPAFSSNASFDPGWTQGAEGATSHDELGVYPKHNESSFV